MGHNKELVILIAILLISVAASLQRRETLTLLPAAFLTLKRTLLSCMDNGATLRKKHNGKELMSVLSVIFEKGQDIAAFKSWLYLLLAL